MDLWRRSNLCGAFALGVDGAAPELAAGIFAASGGAEGHDLAALRALGGGVGFLLLTVLDAGCS